MQCQACFVPALSLCPTAFSGKPALLPRRLPRGSHCSQSPRRRVRTLPHHAIIARTQTSTELEDEVLDSVLTLQEAAGDVGLHRYRSLHPDKFEAAATAVSALELSTGGFGGGASKLRTLLPGNWGLILTDSVAVEKNGGSITGLGSLPMAKCKSVTVELNRDGKARTVEGVEVFAGLMKGENALIGKWRVTGKGARTLEVTYASALLMGKAKVRADSKAVLNTTYCSERLRVGRSMGGEFYLFLRKQDA